MRLREGTPAQKALFGALLGVFLLAVVLVMSSNSVGVGRRNHMGFGNVGAKNPWRILPTGHAATDAGIRWGALLLEVNGESTEGKAGWSEIPLYEEVGQTNRLTFRTPPLYGGEVRTVDLPVTTLTWRDVLAFTGVPVSIGLVFMLTALASFILRPYCPGSWGLLAFGVFMGGFLVMAFEVSGRTRTHVLMLGALASFMALVPVHLALCSITPHRLMVRYRWLPLVIYAPAVPLFLSTAFSANRSVFSSAHAVVLIGATIFSFTRRRRHEDPIARQQSRVSNLAAFGFLPPTIAWGGQALFDTLYVDMRLTMCTACAYPIALGYIIVRHEQIDARIAIRRSVAYILAAAAVVGVSVLIAVVVIAALGRESATWVLPAAWVLVLIPVLYHGRQFDGWLDDRLYPQRSQYPQLQRRYGEEMATDTSVAAILRTLATAPADVCAATSTAAFLLADDPASASLQTTGTVPTTTAPSAHEPLLELLAATRQVIRTSSLAADTQFAHIRADAERTMAALGAQILLPLLREDRVIGALGLGPRVSGDPYSSAELQFVDVLTQQAVQAIIRTEMFDKLQAQQEDMAGLKRFFPPHVVDQVLTQGGTPEFTSTRKEVTVFFSDLRGFTAFSDAVEPEEVTATLHEFHRAMGHRIAEHGGTLERFVGDGFMVFFNDPVEQTDHVQRAVQMAITMRDDVRQLRENWVRKGYQLDAGMGIHTGYATCGFVGYEGRRDYAVTGNVTNMAARLCDAADGGEILISARMHADLGGTFLTEQVGDLAFKGFQQPQATYRVVGAESRV